MSYPLLKIDLAKITHNARKIVEVATRQGVETVGVVKGCSGDPQVAGAMLAGGVSSIADSRVCSLRRLQDSGISPLMMLRQPLREEAEEVVELVSVSLISDYSIVPLLSQAAKARETSHGVILMVETGDLREGVLPQEVAGIALEIRKLENIRLAGIGTNIGCFLSAESSFDHPGLSKPGPEAQLELLVGAAGDFAQAAGSMPEIVSGGNSAIWKLLVCGEVPEMVNQVRIGEAILLGKETLTHEPIEGTYQDAFFLESEVIEVRDKPLSLRDGCSFEVPTRRQAVVAVGKQDIGAGRVFACRPDIVLLEASSDHLVLEIKGDRASKGVPPEDIRPGQILAFVPDYQALAAAMISPFVQKMYLSTSKGKEFELSNISREAVIE